MSQWSNCKIRRKRELTFSQIDGDVVLIHPEDGKYYSFNKVGSFIWNCLDEYKTLDELVTLLLQHYEISEEQCILEVSGFLSQLSKKGLIDVEDI